MGNCLFLRARGWGIDRQMRTKLQIPGGMPGGDMVTGRIEPCINIIVSSRLHMSYFRNMRCLGARKDPSEIRENPSRFAKTSFRIVKNFLYF